MSDWSSVSIKFDVLSPLRGPMQSVLTLLQTIEAVLEALLALVKAFLLDLGNPLKALFALLLAAIRALINQIKSAGFNILLVHPDFSRQDFSAMLQSVSGGYTNFENKVVAKFFDSSDLNRPQFPPGSSVAMLVFYIGVTSPGDLLLQLFTLLRLINYPITLTGVPAPVELRVNPVRASGDPVANFRGLFSPDLKKALVLEWRMPNAPGGSAAPGFSNSLVSFYNSFRIPNFIVERSESPQGSPVPIKVNNQTMGEKSTVASVVKKWNLPPPETDVSLKESDSSVFRHFEKKIVVTGNDLLEGAFTGTYRYIDEDTALEIGKSYFYRVRAYFGDTQNYINADTVGSYQGSDGTGDKTLVKTDRDLKLINFGNNVIMGKPSSVVRGFVPRPAGSDGRFDVYQNLFDAVQAALLLNFDVPPLRESSDPFRTRQMTGWGTLSVAGGQVSLIKSAFSKSSDLQSQFLFTTTARRIANNTLNNLIAQPNLLNYLERLWDGSIYGGLSVRAIVDRIKFLSTTKFFWKVVPITGGITSQSDKKISDYLALEDNYQSGNYVVGPFPITTFNFEGQDISIDENSRTQLAEFLRTALAASSGNVSYLSWYSVSIADLFPAFVPFIFDFEQFILAFLKALESAIQAIEDIIATIIQKIRALEQILQTLLALIDLLDISLNLSVLAVSSDNGSATSLATAVIESEKKPDDNPFGLHSGLVMVAGGPGAGAAAAFGALKFILGIQ